MVITFGFAAYCSWDLISNPRFTLLPLILTVVMITTTMLIMIRLLMMRRCGDE